MKILEIQTAGIEGGKCPCMGGGVLGVAEGKGIEPFLFVHEAFI